jgi:hypothetical protein
VVVDAALAAVVAVMVVGEAAIALKRAFSLPVAV